MHAAVKAVNLKEDDLKRDMLSPKTRVMLNRFDSKDNPIGVITNSPKLPSRAQG